MSATALRGPRFGSYPAAEVSWLLTDLSGRDLELPTTEQERRIQAGHAHYAESLPVEFEPDQRYYVIYRAALHEHADDVSAAVGTCTELMLAERGHNVVLVSLARAGTPVGILMRRWAMTYHGLRPPHFAVSIVRDRGLDENAIRFLLDRFEPEQLVFVDGWTGKGAIARELSAAVDSINAAWGIRLDDRLVVAADPGHCVTTFGTREDLLIPSACLNSTVSGLVSRTVMNRDLIGPDEFHGAKFYAHLSAADESMAFLGAVTARSGAVRDEVRRRVAALRPDSRVPT